MAFPRYGNHRPCRRDGHVCVPDWSGVVGCRRFAGRAILHARLRGRTFAVAGIIAAPCRATRACYLQWKIVRLAAARESLHDDALDRRTEAGGTFGLAASGARFVEAAARFGAARGARTPCPLCSAAGVAPWERFGIGAHPPVFF